MRLLERCRQDREHLFEECRRRLGAPAVFLPADWLDDVLSEILDFDLLERALPDGQMAECDFDRRCLVLSTRLERCVRPRTDLVGLAHSTKAHELGHIRLHESELRAVGCRDLPADDPDYQRREREADLYAATFLVPEGMLLVRSEMIELLELHRQGRSMRSEELWERVLRLAGFFKVTGSLMRRLLVDDLGLLELREPGRELRVSGRELTPFL